MEQQLRSKRNGRGTQGRLSRQGMAWAAGVMLAWATGAWADAILAPGDLMLAIDQDSPYSASAYPTAKTPPEAPLSAIDNTVDSKYLNYAKENSGFIVTLAAGAAVRSFVISTANDYEARDPAAYVLYGTNDAIVSGDNSLGTGENWTLIAAGVLALPAERKTAGPVVSFANETAYTSYKVVFPTLKDTLNANSMQFSEIAMYASADGSGEDVTAPENVILAVDTDIAAWGQYPATEVPAQAIDGDPVSKYLNFGKLNAGFIVTPTVGLSLVTSFQITTANDYPERDPVGWALYGTTSPVASTDNSKGDQEDWTLIAAGDVALPGDLGDPTAGRLTAGPVVSFANATAYNSYRLLFTSVRDAATADAVQIGEIQFFGTILNAVPDQLLSPTDAIVAVNVQRSTSYYRPYDQSPSKAIDSNTGTKYLNFGKEGSGLIVTPLAGATVAKSMMITTANDHGERDPVYYQLFGTNAAVVSEDNSFGDSESWTPIAEGDPLLPGALDNTTGRKQAVTIDLGSNTAAYTAYKIVFTQLRNSSTANSMQISEFMLYDAAGVKVLSANDPVLGISAGVRASSASAHSDTEGAPKAIDRVIGTTTTVNRYRNTSRLFSGFIVTPAVGSTVVNSFRITTAKDAPANDPVKWVLYGTNAAIVSPDNSFGDAEGWTLIASGAMTGTLALPEARLTGGPLITFENTMDYTSYRLAFPTLKYAANGATSDATAMQFAEIQFYGRIGMNCHTPFADADGDQDVDMADFGVFQACFTGTYWFTADRTCRCFDRDKTTSVDLIDLPQFLNCFTGPGVTWTQQLTPGCAP